MFGLGEFCLSDGEWELGLGWGWGRERGVGGAATDSLPGNMPYPVARGLSICWQRD